MFDNEDDDNDILANKKVDESMLTDLGKKWETINQI